MTSCATPHRAACTNSRCRLEYTLKLLYSAYVDGSPSESPEQDYVQKAESFRVDLGFARELNVFERMMSKIETLIMVKINIKEK